MSPANNPNAAIIDASLLVSMSSNEAEHEKAVETFLDLMKIISTPNDETNLVKRAFEIRETYGCSRSSDSLYIALAEDLAKTRTVELLTFDRGMINQAAKNAPTVKVKVL